MKYTGPDGEEVEIEGSPPFDGGEMMVTTSPDGSVTRVKLGTYMAMTHGRGLDRLVPAPSSPAA